MSESIAPFHSMDIPHVAAVELPLNVKNTQKAIAMIGGKEKIKQVINSSNKDGNTYNHTSVENTLELRLRKDPFHHPIQSSYNTSEKILLKVSIPKASLPDDYDKYSIKDLIKLNKRDHDAPKYKVQPVAIIDQTYSFKSVADFQITTKNNAMVQDFKESMLNFRTYEDVQKYFERNNNMMGISDYKDLKYYENIDHGLPPPPILSPIRFPFDYKYQKNPFTTAIKDSESGEIKVVSTKNTLKLYTKMIDYNTNDVPSQPADELIENLAKLQSTNHPVNSPDYQLLKCIEWLRQVFELKPIWLRKQLEDIVPVDLKKFIKQSLPYVTYIYRSGPWRFCNVKFGINPKSDSSFWKYQSEYFRIAGLKFVTPKREVKRIKPNTIEAGADDSIAVSEYLFFNGNTLPSTVTYQIGDLLDTDITTIIKTNQNEMGKEFLREVPDFQDGWINRQTMEVVRRIVRYKLNRIVNEEPIHSDKILKIIQADYTESHEKKPDAEEEEDDDEDEREPEADDENVDIDIADEEHIGEGVPEHGTPSIDETLTKLSLLNPEAAKRVNELVGLIKQDSTE